MAPFLTARWRQLAMLNYRVDAAALRALVPRGTELDDFRGNHFRQRRGKRWQTLSLEAEPQPAMAAADSEERFITEHYWGYARQRDGGTVEYQVEHPPWNVSRAIRASLEAAVEQLDGAAFAPLLQGAPASAFLADGSAVAVHRGHRVT